VKTTTTLKNKKMKASKRATLINQLTHQRTQISTKKKLKKNTSQKVMKMKMKMSKYKPIKISVHAEKMLLQELTES